MASEALEFPFDMHGVDREALLREAAQRARALEGHFGAGGGEEGPTGKFMTLAMEDAVRLGAFPDVYRITAQDWIARGRPAPVRLTELSRSFNFYWIRIPVGLMPARGWAFHRLDARIEMNPEQAEPELRPRSYQVLPDPKFQTLMQANLGLKVQLDENFEFKAQVPEVAVAGEAGEGSLELKAGVDAVASGGLGAVLGPFDYHIRKAIIRHNGVGLEWVFWRLEGAKFTDEDRPDLIVIAQVPKATTQVRIKAQLQVYRKLGIGTADVMDIVREMPTALHGFFKAGMPVCDEKDWDITPRL